MSTGSWSSRLLFFTPLAFVCDRSSSGFTGRSANQLRMRGRPSPRLHQPTRAEDHAWMPRAERASFGTWLS